jgi:hypothetical protein
VPNVLLLLIINVLTHCRISGMLVLTLTLKSSHLSATSASSGFSSWKVIKERLDSYRRQ